MAGRRVARGLRVLTFADALHRPSDDARAGLRIALAFAGAFTFSEAADLQLSFLAPLIAGAVASAPAAPVAALMALPVIAWLLVAGAGLALHALAGMPLVLCLLLLPIFRAGFLLSADPRKSTIGLLMLAIFAIVPEVLIKDPALLRDLARWFFSNVAVATASVFCSRLLLPDRAPPPPSAPRATPQPPLVAAAALLLAVVLVAAMQPPAPGAVLIGVIITLRADGETAARVIQDRFLAAILGGAAALLVWELIWLAPSLPVLATATLLLAWPFARRIAAGGSDQGVAMKSLNAFAILLGEGFSIFYEDTDDRLRTRFAGVVIGLTYAALALAVTGALSRSRRRAATVGATVG